MASRRVRLAERLEAGLETLNRVASWLWLALIGLIVSTVVLRYAFGSGRVDLEELQWHLYAMGFLVGIVACTAHDRHVRVDVFRERMSARTRAWIDFYGILLLQLPFLALVLWSALPFVLDSFAVAERSGAPGGLPHRWILKACIPTAAALLVLASGARLLRTLDALFPASEHEVHDERP